MADHKDSVEVLEGRLKNFPDSLAFAQLADAYRKQGNIAEAINICRKGLEAHPDYVTGRIILGRCFLEQENFSEATGEFIRVCTSDRHNHVAIKMLADIYLRQQMKEKAGDMYVFLSKLDPDNPLLARLVSSTPGNGVEDILEIIGAAPAASASPRSPARQPAPAVVEQEAPAAEPEQFGQPADTDENPFSGSDTPAESLEDIGIGPGPGLSDAPASGVSLPDRVSMLFEDEAEPARGRGSALPADSGAEELSNAIENADTIAFTNEPAPGFASSVTGSDITNRIQQLFEEESTVPVQEDDIRHMRLATSAAAQEKAPPAPKHTAEEDIFATLPPLSDADSLDTDDLLSGGLSSGDIETHLEEQPDSDQESMPQISGADVTGRLHDMFEQETGNADDGSRSGESGPGFQEVTGDEGDETASPDAGPDDEERGLITGSDITARLDEIFFGQTGAQPPHTREDTRAIPRERIDAALAGPAGADTPAARRARDMAGKKTKFSLASDILGRSDQRPDAAGPAGTDTGDPFGEEALLDTRQFARDPSAPSGIAPSAPAFADRAAGGPPDTEDEDAEEPSDALFDDEPAIPAAVESPDAAKQLVSGDDVAGKLDELFGGDDMSGPETADSIPDEESEEVSDGFYTVSGDAASAAAVEPAGVDGLEAVELEQPVNDIFAEEPAPDAEAPAAEPAANTDEREPPAAADDPFAEIERQESAVSSEPPAADTSMDDTTLFTAGQSDERPSTDAPAAQTAAPSNDLFLNDDLAGKDVLPDDFEKPVEEVNEGFYTVTGNAADESGEDRPSTADTMPADTALESPLETVMEDEEPAAAPLTDGETGVDFNPVEGPEADAETFNPLQSIPDHVLTPTLADLYYQQGQPHLALQIYQRLLDKNPDNEKYQLRIADIVRAIAEGAFKKPVAPGPAGNGAGKTPVRPAGTQAATARKKQPAAKAARPLSGVRIKKKYRDRLKNRP